MSWLLTLLSIKLIWIDRGQKQIPLTHLVSDTFVMQSMYIRSDGSCLRKFASIRVEGECPIHWDGWLGTCKYSWCSVGIWRFTCISGTQTLSNMLDDLYVWFFRKIYFCITISLSLCAEKYTMTEALRIMDVVPTTIVGPRWRHGKRWNRKVLVIFCHYHLGPDVAAGTTAQVYPQWALNSFSISTFTAQFLPQPSYPIVPPAWTRYTYTSWAWGCSAQARNWDLYMWRRLRQTGSTGKLWLGITV